MATKNKNKPAPSIASTNTNVQAAWPFVCAIGFGALVMFQLQPMLAKPLLPVLGGTPMVWQVCMMVFQGLLLAGYAYAFWLTSRAPKVQWLVHGGLWSLALLSLFFPIPPLVALDAAHSPALWLIEKLLREIGLPFVALSATTPLLQRWASLHRPGLGKNAFRLYVASNLGSFGGLLSYPFLVEPWFTLAQQQEGLRIGFALQFVMIIWAIATATKANLTASADTVTDKIEAGEKPIRAEQAMWVLYAAVGCSLMLGTTQHLSIDVASFPMLWIFPLALYLLSFTVVFGRGAVILPHLQRASVLIIALPIFLSGIIGVAMNFKLLMALLLFALFLQCLLVHGWLANAQPAPRYASQYYLAISLGGVLAGIFNGLLAPVLFNRIFEYELAMIAMLVLAAWQQTPRLWQDKKQLRVVVWLMLVIGIFVGINWFCIRMNMPFTKEFLLQQHGVFLLLLPTLAMFTWFPQWRWAQIVPLLMVLFILNLTYQTLNERHLVQVRSWFSVMRVNAYVDRKLHTLSHGTTLHGIQNRAPGHERDVLSYYRSLEYVWNDLPASVKQKPYAVIGLGTGTLSCLTGGSHPMDMFEIDPEMVAIAENPEYFSFLKECGAQARMIVGDGRIMMQDSPEHGYGLLVIDAFSSDAVPTHLLTQEAIQLYLSKLAPDGVIAFNISSRHLDLAAVVGSIAAAEKLHAYHLQFRPNEQTQDGVLTADWVFLSRTPRPALVAIDTSEMRSRLLEDHGPNFLWRDDYSAIWPVIR